MSAKVIPLSQQQQDWVRKEINNQLCQGLIRPLMLPFAVLEWTYNLGCLVGEIVERHLGYQVKGTWT
jgi:hypothetical protein